MKPLNQWDAVFFPPSARYAELMAEKLTSIPHHRSPAQCRDAFGKLCGYWSWDDLIENLATDKVTTTVWDDEVDVGTLGERRDVQITGVSDGLHVSEAQAASILEMLEPSRRPRVPSDEDLDDFCARFDSWILRARQLGLSRVQRKLLVKPSTKRTATLMAPATLKLGQKAAPSRIRF